MGKDLIYDPDFDLGGDDLEHDDIPEECFEEDPMEEFMCELEAFLDVEIDEDTAELIAKAVEFYFMTEEDDE